MIKINKKKYELVELSAREYQKLMDEIHKQFGDGWQEKAEQHGVRLSILMLMGCLRAEDGSQPTEDELWDQTIKTIQQLGKQVREMNGLGVEQQAALEKN